MATDQELFPRDTKVTARDIGNLQKVTAARIHTMDADRIVMELDAGNGMLTIELADVDARDLSKLLGAVVEDL